MNDEGPRIVETDGGLSVACGPLWLYSRRAPERAARRIADSAELQGSTLYIVPSPCLGYGLDALLEKLPHDSALLCIELDPRLTALCGSALRPYRGLSRIAFVDEAAPGRALLEALEAARGLGRFRRVTKLRLSQGEELHAAAYQGIIAALEDDLSMFWRNKLSLVRMSRLWTKNFFFNIGAMDWTRVLASPLPSARAVAVCGAGTTLDKALPFLRAAGRELHIMACDTAAGALAKAGVRVDSVVCLEGQVYNVADFLPLERRPLLSFLDLSAHPSSYRAAEGPLCLLGSRWMDTALHGRFASSGLPCLTVDPLASVGVLALHLARRLFSGPIFLAGLDFSYPQGKTHCLGSPNDIAERGRETRRYKADGRWRTSFREGAARLSSGFLSDPALSLYASLASRELSALEEGRAAYDLRQGLGAALPAIAIDFEGARRILAASAAAAARQVQAAPRQGRAASAAKAARQVQAAELLAEQGEGRASPADIRSNQRKGRAFLESELGLAARLRAALKDGAAGGELLELVKACDYMYAHFPDPERVQALELDALKRLAAEASYWEGRIRSALS